MSKEIKVRKTAIVKLDNFQRKVRLNHKISRLRYTRSKGITVLFNFTVGPLNAASSSDL